MVIKLRSKNSSMTQNYAHDIIIYYLYNPFKFVIILNNCMRINYLVVNVMKTVKLGIPCCSLVLKPFTVAGKKNTQTNISIQGWKVYNRRDSNRVPLTSLVRYVNRSAIAERRIYFKFKYLTITCV